MTNFREKFITEANNLIQNLEESLEKLEKNPKDTETIFSVFRVIHSLKGGGGMFGFEEISNFSTSLEDIYNQIRNGEKQVTTELIEVTRESAIHYKNLLKEDIEISSDIKKVSKMLIKKVSAL